MNLKVLNICLVILHTNTMNSCHIHPHNSSGISLHPIQNFTFSSFWLKKIFYDLMSPISAAHMWGGVGCQATRGHHTEENDPPFPSSHQLPLTPQLGVGSCDPLPLGAKLDCLLAWCWAAVCWQPRLLWRHEHRRPVTTTRHRLISISSNLWFFQSFYSLSHKILWATEGKVMRFRFLTEGWALPITSSLHFDQQLLIFHQMPDSLNFARVLETFIFASVFLSFALAEVTCSSLVHGFFWHSILHFLRERKVQG